MADSKGGMLAARRAASRELLRAEPRAVLMVASMAGRKVYC
jgi:hypothetical protein